MSYILDALRKADAERERDPARGIHAQPAAVLPARPARALPPWAWAGGAAVAALAAGYAVWGRDAAVPAAPVRVAAPAVAPVAEPPPARAVTVAATIQPPAPPALPEHPSAAAKAVAHPAPAATPASAAPGAKAAASASTVAAAVPASPSASAAAASRIFAVSELPSDVQRELPKLAISGGVYSENVAQRILIVGGQVVGQGAQLAPGVVLDEIRPRSAVLRFRNWRYSVSY